MSHSALSTAMIDTFFNRCGASYFCFWKKYQLWGLAEVQYPVPDVQDEFVTFSVRYTCNAL